MNDSWVRHCPSLLEPGHPSHPMLTSFRSPHHPQSRQGGEGWITVVQQSRGDDKAVVSGRPASQAAHWQSPAAWNACQCQPAMIDPLAPLRGSGVLPFAHRHTAVLDNSGLGAFSSVSTLAHRLLKSETVPVLLFGAPG